MGPTYCSWYGVRYIVLMSAGELDIEDGIFSLEDEFANSVRSKDEHVSPPSRRGVPPSVLVMY